MFTYSLKEMVFVLLTELIKLDFEAVGIRQIFPETINCYNQSDDKY